MTDAPQPLEVTWTPATCDGLPPVGTKIAIPSINKNGVSAWSRGRIQEYLMPYDRSPGLHGDVPYIVAAFEGLGTYFAVNIELSQCPLLGIEKQPEGWPDHMTEPPKLFEAVLYRYHVSEDEMARQMIMWLKDNGYLKR